MCYKSIEVYLWFLLISLLVIYGLVYEEEMNFPNLRVNIDFQLVMCSQSPVLEDSSPQNHVQITFGPL